MFFAVGHRYTLEVNSCEAGSSKRSRVRLVDINASSYRQFVEALERDENLARFFSEVIGHKHYFIGGNYEYDCEAFYLIKDLQEFCATSQKSSEIPSDPFAMTFEKAMTLSWELNTPFSPLNLGSGKKEDSSQ